MLFDTSSFDFTFGNIEEIIDEQNRRNCWTNGFFEIWIFKLGIQIKIKNLNEMIF